ncbi:DUF6978 family protein [Heliophilum fasciatum]|uniref:Uncharacterized protein n=1 Tax=Heliophilum fasciatum TaxID=35700 RepID=A0A4R2S0B9_9FIRM|nr:hypothetical protein [Heliophilum fasciatum]MCW2276923.1 hypothetical protein [Heliophilum fasciatum]TCP68617.1 hypothetical protein EDD73_10212 [Heliophilum fasciatum]
MDMTNEEAEKLLETPKFIVLNDEKIENMKIPTNSAAVNLRLNAISDDGEHMFLFTVQQSAKYNIKITLHFQEDNTKVGLLRIDFNGCHKNPDVITPHVPLFIQPYASKFFDFEDHHIHYHVQGYKTLSWAVPLAVDVFPVKTIDDFTSFQQAILCFGKRIRLNTELDIEKRLFL